MENTKQADSQLSLSSSQNSIMEYQLLRERRDKLKLDLTNISDRKHKFQSILTSPDLKMLKLASPELEKLILSQQSLFTPTPTQYFFPNKPATEEQELYARGFLDALANIKQKYQSSFGLNNGAPNYVSFVNNRGNSNRCPTDFSTIYFPPSFTNSFYQNNSHTYNGQSAESSNAQISLLKEGHNNNVYNKYNKNGDILSCIFFNNYNFNGQNPPHPEQNDTSYENHLTTYNNSIKPLTLPSIPHYIWTTDSHPSYGNNGVNGNQITQQQDNSISSLDQKICYAQYQESNINNNKDGKGGISFLPTSSNSNLFNAPQIKVEEAMEERPISMQSSGEQPLAQALGISLPSDNSARCLPFNPHSCLTDGLNYIKKPDTCHNVIVSSTLRTTSAHDTTLPTMPNEQLKEEESYQNPGGRRDKKYVRSIKNEFRGSRAELHPPPYSKKRTSNVSNTSTTLSTTTNEDNCDEEFEDSHSCAASSETDDHEAEEYLTASYAINGSGTCMSPINLEAQEIIKVERKRLRNRIAATKCRRRKLERIYELEKVVGELKQKNERLQAQFTGARDRVQSLKSCMERHVEHGCQMLDRKI